MANRKISASCRAQFRSLCEMFNWRCVGCGRNKRLYPDHVRHFGPNTVDNLQPLCLGCNNRKGKWYVDLRVQPHPDCAKPGVEYRAKLPVALVPVDDCTVTLIRTGDKWHVSK